MNRALERGPLSVVRPQTVPFRPAAGPTGRVGNHGWRLTGIMGNAKGASFLVVAPGL